MKQAERSPVLELFEKAKERGGFEYLYALIRIEGIQCYEGYEDELIALHDWLTHPDVNDLVRAFRYLASLSDPLELLQNLLNCANRKPYHVSPFMHLKKGKFPNYVWPSTLQKVEALTENARATGFPRLADRLQESYPPQLLGNGALSVEQVTTAFESLSKLLEELLDCYFDKRLRFKDGPKYIKLPDSLDVLELITDEEFGLSGLRVHFSQGCTADFYRTRKGVFGTNLELGPPVTFLMMSIEPSTNEYRVNGRRLYEIGLPGRYNNLGEWKPLIYPGNSDNLAKECMQLSDDPDVQGALLYLRLTGHRCIEFVLRTNLDFPGTLTSSKTGAMHMWKCPDAGYASNSNVRVYDCWIDLETGTVDEIESTLSGIGRFVSIFCFPFGATYSWRTKYKMSAGGGGTLTPTENDLTIIEDIIKNFPETAGGGILESGIDWFNRGNISANIFTKFFCYYVAFESVATAIADGEDLGNIYLANQTKGGKGAFRVACIKQKYDELFASDPIDFVIESYFECVQSLTAKTKKVASAVFGEGHEYLKLLFQESSGGDIALSKLRSELAHGYRTLLDKQHERLFHKHLFEMGRIAKEFLLRVLFRLEPSEKVPSWSQQFQVSFITADPRSTMVASTSKVFPTGANWKIRPEWCE